jgi:hypothetical protein
MTHMPRRLALTAAVVAASVMAIPVAKAFTFEGNSNASGGARYADPDAQFDSNNNNGRATIRNGGTTLQFGPGAAGTFDQRYDQNRMFDTLGGPGRDGYR